MKSQQMILYLNEVMAYRLASSKQLADAKRLAEEAVKTGGKSSAASGAQKARSVLFQSVDLDEFLSEGWKIKSLVGGSQNSGSGFAYVVLEKDQE